MNSSVAILSTLLRERAVQKLLKPQHCSLLSNVSAYYFLPTNKEFHVSSHVYSGYSSKHKKRKIALEKVLNKKVDAHFKKRKVVNIYSGMLISEIALLANRTDDQVIEAIRLCDTEEMIPDLNGTSPISNIPLLISTVKRLGCRYFVLSNEWKQPKEDKNIYRRPLPDEDSLVPRRPIVTVMGHVDHGKTTLLDALRKTSVAQQEVGGITQSIGAFTVQLQDGQPTTFIDTPGHAAFSSMRERGVQATDIVVLVVAADDGVMPQTMESIKLAQNADVPMVVAVNKCDLPSASAKLVLEELSEHGVVTEPLGGDVPAVNVSALKEKGLDKLVEAILISAELMEIRADPSGFVEGVILESQQLPQLGVSASVIVQRGTLKPRQILVAGTAMCSVRAIYDENNKVIKEVGPGIPVRITGWKDTPNTGDIILQAESRAQAKAAISWRKAEDFELHKDDHLSVINERRESNKKLQTEMLVNKVRKIDRYRINMRKIIEESNKESSIPQFNIIVKADAVGSLTTLLQVFDLYDERERCRFNVISSGVGNVSATDLETAQTTQAIIYLFNLEAPPATMKNAENLGVEVIPHQIIYRIFDDIKNRILDLIPPTIQITVEGEAVVEKTFNEKVAGCKVKSGSLTSDGIHRVIRDGEEVHRGELFSLKYVKENISKAKSGSECGVRFKGDFNFIKGDIIHRITLGEPIKQLNWYLPGSEPQ